MSVSVEPMTRIIRVSYPKEGAEVQEYHGPFASVEHFAAWLDEVELGYGPSAKFELLMMRMPEVAPKPAPRRRTRKAAAV